MEQVVIRIKNKSSKELFLNFIKHLDFISVVDSNKIEKNHDKKVNFSELCGIWKDRNISIEEIREKAWSRK